ncbi:acyloxyacyl hydrolase [Altererythrobacter sp. SALINAS58]|uniref:acyloxyacyl hydrolase n=1 Tax=Alteripontixanthobacter muriae TaxID=2705546 RepID=UPI001575432B|nr:acyloxyacyl hydrolase [Alteripontixanthobacter muriae]NTZ43811.1 acyloxyacyl hydrolase [Alteripontixanthobacter muriae]
MSRSFRASGLRSFAHIAIFGSIAAANPAANPAAAGEVYGGIYAHAVDTPFTFDTEEGGVDLQAGYRFERAEALAFIGSPEPYVFASLNSEGDTNFAGGGLSWKIAAGPVYLRPGIGLVIHDAPDFRIDRNNEFRTDLGSRILFEPEIAIGTAVSERWSVEASWVHISNARLFNSEQNPGIDTIGIRLNYGL